MVLGGGGQVEALVHHVSGVLTHALRAVHIAIFGIAYATFKTIFDKISTVDSIKKVTSSFGLVPLIVSEGLRINGIRFPFALYVFTFHGGIVKVLNCLASSMAAAVIGTKRALASTALVAIKTFTFTGLPVAKSFI